MENNNVSNIMKRNDNEVLRKKDFNHHFLKWLFQKINKYSDLNNKFILDIYFQKILLWIQNNNFHLKKKIDLFKIHFYLLFYLYQCPINEVITKYSVKDNFNDRDIEKKKHCNHIEHIEIMISNDIIITK